MTYDVVIIGAGPGGSTIAKYAALGGAKVLMIEKRQEIGSPVRCGEGLPKINFDEMGLEINEKWIVNELKGGKLVSPDGTTIAITEKMAPDTGYLINRTIFDQELAKEAARCGADIMVKTTAIGLLKENDKVVGIKARHMGEDIEIRANIVVGADGFESKVGGWAGIDTRLQPSDVNVCYQYHMVGIDGEEDFNYFYFGSQSPGGYIWVFSRGKDEANIGIGVQLSKIKEKGTPKKLLDAFIARHPKYAKGQPIKEIAGSVSTCLPIEESVKGNVMLVGDAARQIDPLTGGGISFAMIAGRMAGEVIVNAVKAQDFSEEFLMQYDKMWRERLEEQIYRDFLAKEKASQLSDDTFNKMFDALQDTALEQITMRNIMQAIQKKYPEVVEELEELL